jgi:uncharacterized protein YqgQ
VGSDTYRDWYLANRDRVNADRRQKYADDPELRSVISQRSKNRWTSGKSQRIRFRQEKVLKSLGFIDVLDVENIRHVRIALIGEELRRIYSSKLLSCVLGIDVWTLKRWEKADAIIRPDFVDDSGRNWFTRDSIQFMFDVVKDHRAENYRLSDFGKVVQSIWRGRNGNREG